MAAFARILFPTDFSSGADHALESALCLPGVREVIVQHVVRTYFEKHSHWSTLFDIHEMQKYMDMYVETEMKKIMPRTVANAVTFRTVISEGKPAQQIVDLAEKERADCIVMGPAKGVVSGLVIRASGRPVLNIPQNGQETVKLRKVKKMLVPTDCSPHSKRVIDYSFELKDLFDCELLLLHVIELSNTIRFGIQQGYFTDATTRMRTWAKNQLENLTPHQYVTDSSVHRLIDEGSAAEKIAEYAENNNVDMVVLGAHGYGPVQKHFVGTTTDKMLMKVSRPMLTVKI
jgi:nucleotide-binding universal stress UspA family protein